MILNIYTIKDKKSHFGNPFCDLNDNTAMRAFALQAALPESVIGFAPDDYDLYCVGTFNSDNAEVKVSRLPEFVCSAADVLNVFTARKDDK